jgi:hypothetical protein
MLFIAKPPGLKSCTVVRLAFGSGEPGRLGRAGVVLRRVGPDGLSETAGRAGTLGARAATAGRLGLLPALYAFARRAEAGITLRPGLFLPS